MIVYFDCEVEAKSHKIVDFGAISQNNARVHSSKHSVIKKTMLEADFYCGHNVVNHDVPYLKSIGVNIDQSKVIDTLFWSVLLYPQRPYHKLVKDDKLYPEQDNNPLLDAQKAKDLFNEELASFSLLTIKEKQLLYGLLKDKDGFSAFFDLAGFKSELSNLSDLVHDMFRGMLCSHSSLEKLISENPVELAYTLRLINTTPDSLFPSWLLYQFPEVEDVMILLRGTPCNKGCLYCDDALNAVGGLKRFFGYDRFRSFEGKPLQELSVKAALENRSLIAVFPTGGGKSITYQIPALMSGVNTRSLTVVISPLQSLMKDQVDNLEKKNITWAGYINGLLDPIERTKTIERVQKGDISLLYISPESLRSRSIENLLLSRDIARFVIDEAHCFSVWGHDFRVDYLYIGRFIRQLELKKRNYKKIPVSCFTATAKKQVIEDIEMYFAEKLGLRMERFTIQSARKNLRFQVYNVENDEEKYQQLRKFIEQKPCSTIVYASRQKRVENVAKRLNSDGYQATFFHGGLKVEEKIENQNLFMQGKTPIMVATNAFGMGVDKSDVGMVIHYDVSDSLENYVQEAGRAGRDETLNADCLVLYQEEDLDKHFSMLRRSKLQMTEIQQVWQAIKTLTKVRNTVSYSALEIAREAGWDDSIHDIETKVKTAISALEETGYLERKQNNPRVFADSILVNSYIEAEKLIDDSKAFTESDVMAAKRVVKSLIGSKYRKRQEDEMPEARVDYLCDNLALEKSLVIEILNTFREINILSDVKDISCNLPKDIKQSKAFQMLENTQKMEQILVEQLLNGTTDIHLKRLNEIAEESDIKINPKQIRKLINFLKVMNVIDIKRSQKDRLKLKLLADIESYKKTSQKRFDLTIFIIQYLYNNLEIQDDKRVMFSLKELKEAYQTQQSLFVHDISTKDIENALYYLSKLEIIQIEGGFLVTYNPMTIVRRERNNAVRYKRQDYQKLEAFYAQKIQQIHIVGEYAKLMIDDYKKALKFVDDYFVLDFTEFIQLYFKGSRRKDIEKNLTTSLMKKLFGQLSPRQLSIVNDHEHNRIVVSAGPGSGKTRVLVHKLAAILYTENIPSDQLLMLTFSRSAVSEFKDRLVGLIGNAAYYVEIKTFHSFAFDVLGRLGSLEQTDLVMQKAIDMIESREVDLTKVTKLMLVVDEAQDMDANSFRLVELLMEQNEDMRVILVGDDDQNIYSFRGSSSKYLERFKKEGAAFYELPTNYRATKNLVSFANEFVNQIQQRMKSTPIKSNTSQIGNLRVIQHSHKNMYKPLIKHFESLDLEGNVGILTRTNEQALVMTGLLNKYNHQATLIQASHSFRLINLKEVRAFIDLITKNDKMSVILPEMWETAISQWLEIHQGTPHVNVIFNLFERFNYEHSKTKYLTDLREFIEESSYDDFVINPRIAVSTYHKTKGKEFNHVFIMNDSEALYNDEERRLLYVAMTRARKSLFIHYVGDFFQDYSVEHMKYYKDQAQYNEPERLVYTLTHKDVQLGYFAFVQKAVNNLKSGDQLELNEESVLTHNGNKILKFSYAYQNQLSELSEKGYVLSSACVKYLVYWYDINNEKEELIVLPELVYDFKGRN